MKTPTTRADKKLPRLDPWVLCRHLVETLLLPYPDIRARVMGYVRARNLPALASLGQIDDVEYHVAELAPILAQRQIASIFKKNEAFADENRCSQAAQENFERGERVCRITNKRLDYFHAAPDRNDPQLAKYVRRMESEIKDLLGDSKVYLQNPLKGLRLTNGASESRPRRRSFPFLKISGKLRAPKAAVVYIGKALLEMGVDLASCVYTCVERNVLALVPKNWKTHRIIAKEPDHALPFQLQLDGYLKKVLRKWGIDLSRQERNQELARLGSIDGSFATIDLTMASDTLSLNCVAWLLPYDWYVIFTAYRSSSYSAPWGDGSYAKFSSMGNGYTFSLETLIFTAACRAVGSRQHAVYGDDIVVKTEYVPELVRLLRFLGFRTNADKTFCNPDSRFRESCGCDYFEGVLVTPFYLRDCPKYSDHGGMSHAINGLVACSWPGPLWDYLALLVRETKLRLVPLNEDSRSGVFITPRTAWNTKVVKVDRRRWRKKRNPSFVGPRAMREINPDYGFPIFEGYGPTQDVRKTTGWRSLFLWHLQGVRRVEDVPTVRSNRTAVYLMQLRDGRTNDFGVDAARATEVIVNTRWVHKTRRFWPTEYTAGPMLPLWEQKLGIDR